MISNHKTRKSRLFYLNIFGITVKLCSFCGIVLYLASFPGSRELYFKFVESLVIKLVEVTV